MVMYWLCIFYNGYKSMTILDLSIVTHSFKYDRIPSGKLTVENGHLLR